MTSHQRPAKMTAAKLPIWRAAHATAIEQVQERRRRKIADSVSVYLHQAVRDWGMTENAAGDDLLLRFPYGSPGGRTPWTPGELKDALASQGWRPKRLRGKGGAA